jgi:hypothetical protein
MQVDVHQNPQTLITTQNTLLGAPNWQRDNECFINPQDLGAAQLDSEGRDSNNQIGSNKLWATNISYNQQNFHGIPDWNYINQPSSTHIWPSDTENAYHSNSMSNIGSTIQTDDLHFQSHLTPGSLSSLQYVHCGSGNNRFSQTPLYPTVTSSATGLSLTNNATEAPAQSSNYYSSPETNSTTGQASFPTVFTATSHSLPITSIENNRALLSDLTSLTDKLEQDDLIYCTFKSICPHLSDKYLRQVQQVCSWIDIGNSKANLESLKDHLYSNFQPNTSYSCSLKENAVQVFWYLQTLRKPKDLDVPINCLA